MLLTLNKIMQHAPCGQDPNSKTGFSKGLKLVHNKGLNSGSEFTLIDILESSGIKDAVWCLRCFPYLDICLFLADVAKSVLPIFEAKNGSKAPRLAIQGIYDFKAGEISKAQLQKLSDDAAAIGDTVAAAAASYSYSSSSASDDFAYTAYSAYTIASAAAADSVFAYDTSAYASDASAKAKKWQEIETLFVKYFGNKK